MNLTRNERRLLAAIAATKRGNLAIGPRRSAIAARLQARGLVYLTAPHKTRCLASITKAGLLELGREVSEP